MTRPGTFRRAPTKAITQEQAAVHLLQALVMMPDALLASHDHYSLGRMYRVPLKRIAAMLDKERQRRAGPEMVLL